MKPKLKRKITRLKREKKRKMIQEAFSGNLPKDELIRRRDAASFRFYELLRQAEPLKQQLEQIQQQSHDAQREIQAYSSALTHFDRQQQNEPVTAAGNDSDADAEKPADAEPVAVAAEPDTNVVPLKSRKRKGH